MEKSLQGVNDGSRWQRIIKQRPPQQTFLYVLFYSFFTEEVLFVHFGIIGLSTRVSSNYKKLIVNGSHEWILPTVFGWSRGEMWNKKKTKNTKEKNDKQHFFSNKTAMKNKGPYRMSCNPTVIKSQQFPVGSQPLKWFLFGCNVFDNWHKLAGTIMNCTIISPIVYDVEQ